MDHRFESIEQQRHADNRSSSEPLSVKSLMINNVYTAQTHTLEEAFHGFDKHTRFPQIYFIEKGQLKKRPNARVQHQRKC